MTLWRSGMLLAAGSIVGLALAAWLESEYKSELKDGSIQKTFSKADGIELLVEKVRQEALWSMEDCTSDKERENVYVEISNSIKELQDILQKRGTEIISDIKGHNWEGEDVDNVEECKNKRIIRNYRSSIENPSRELDEVLASIKTRNC